MSIKRIIRHLGRRYLYFRYHLTADYVKSSPHVIYVKPEKIKRETRTYWGSLLDEPGLVLGGPWDKFATEFNERQKVRALKSRLVHGTEWDETEYYNRILRRIESGRSWRGCEDEEDLRNKLAEYELIYDQMGDSGYKSQKELNEPQHSGNRIGEIGVNVGREGELFWHDDGQSRLTLAKLQELDEVPVEVLARHKKWWQLRSEIKSCDNISNLSQSSKNKLDHPDMRDVV